MTEQVTLTNLPVNYREEMARQVAELSKRLAPASGDKIRITQDKQFVFPDGTTTKDPFDCVIVDFVAANDYYEEAYQAGNAVPPNCFARGLEPQLLVPSPNSPEKQAESCAVCPQNQFGSAGRGKACKNSRLLAVLPPDATVDSPIWLIQVSPTALTAFDKYIAAIGTTLKSMPFAVITKIGFDPNSTFASLRFGRPELLPEEKAVEFFARQAEARQRLMQEPDVSAFGQQKIAPPKSLRRR